MKVNKIGIPANSLVLSGRAVTKISSCRGYEISRRGYQAASWWGGGVGGLRYAPPENFEMKRFRNAISSIFHLQM